MSARASKAAWNIHRQKVRIGNVTKRGAVWRLRWTIDGSPVDKTYKTHKEADRVRRHLLNAVEEGVRFDPVTKAPVEWGSGEVPAVVQWLDTWIAGRAKPGSPANTRKGDIEIAVDMVEATLLRTSPEGADVRMWAWRWFTRKRDETDPVFTGELLRGAIHVERWSPRLDEIDAEALWDRLGRNLDGGKAKPNYARRRRNLAARVLKDAVKKRLLVDNPLDWIEKDLRAPSMAVDPTTLPPRGEARGFIGMVAAKGDVGERGFAFLHTILDSGCRPAEALGLMECDIIRPDGDRKGYYLRLTRGVTLTNPALTDDGVGWQARDVLKWRSEGDFRLVPVRRELIKMIDAHIAKYGTATDGRIFVTKGGNPIATTLAGVWRKAVKEHYPTGDYSALRPYDLRHIYATTCLAEGIDEGKVSKYMGNSIDVLRKTYRGAFPDNDADYEKIIAALE